MSERSELELEGLRAGVAGKEILRGVDLVVRSGEVHAVMGPNGSGKSTLSHVIMGRPSYEVLGGTITLDGADVLAMAPHERATAGLFLAMQYPTEVPRVSLEAMLTEALVGAGRVSAVGEVRARMVAEAERIGFDERFLQRPLNVDLSGGDVLVKGRIVAIGGPELADELEHTGYAGFTVGDDEPEEPARTVAGPPADPFADPLA